MTYQPLGCVSGETGSYELSCFAGQRSVNSGGVAEVATSGIGESPSDE